MIDRCRRLHALDRRQSTLAPVGQCSGSGEKGGHVASEYLSRSAVWGLQDGNGDYHAG